MSFLTQFRKWKDVQAYPSGAEIFAAGTAADALFILLDGEVELTLRGEDLSTERAGSIIGITAIQDAAARSTTARAKTDVKLARVEREQVRALMDENAEFAKQVMSVLAKRLRDVDTYITTHLELRK